MLKLYNTLSRTKEDFVPLVKKNVKMYTCGPTVYNYAHIGNLRTYVFMDILRRVLKYGKYNITGVLNITDVGHLVSDADDGEDKMAITARKQNKSPYEIAAYYTDVFLKDTAALNIGKPEILAYATEHIAEMIEYCKDLEEKGYAYETADGLYFDIQKFENYGKLSGIDLDEQQAGARVKVNDGKRHHADFAIWKKAEPNHIMQWDSPWGRGYPGWHIECSAMSRKYLGTTMDIHTGGVDHIPIHHENEIAQAEAREACKTVNYWLHGEFMLVDGGKMSKSLGNTYTVTNLIERGYSPLDFRYFCFSAHYRKRLNFTFEGLDAAKTAYGRLLVALAKHKAAAPTIVMIGSLPLVIDKVKKEKGINKKIKEYQKQFDEAIFDDLNIPLALGVLWTAVKEEPNYDIYKLALKFDKILGLNLNKLPKEPKQKKSSIPAKITTLAEKRKTAKANKDYALADTLRKEIESLGYTITDISGGGYELIKN
ncbi:MAG: cysteine--tRNA ligase [Firmicutes bacterium]|nr:cysteine--tRNA ligase [Bacillota bacterium]